MSVFQDVSNWLLGSYKVRTTQLTNQALIQHMRLDFGSGTSESTLTTANPLPVSVVASAGSDTAYTVRVDEGATYTYIGEADPGSAEGDAVWRVKRMTNATTTILWADGDTNFDNVWTNRASLTYT